MINELLTHSAQDDIFEGARKGVHGVQHWFKVAQLAVMIARAEGGDAKVALLFGLYHDCRRENDGRDILHGKRASDLMRRHFERGDLKIDKDQADLLSYALIYHSDGRIVADPTISACWDADRLDLPRCGTQTGIEYLGTNTAKELCRLQEDFYMGDHVNYGAR